MAQREALEREQEWNSEAGFPFQLYPAECLRELSLPLCSSENKDPSPCLPLGSAESNKWRSGHQRKKSHLWSRNCAGPRGRRFKHYHQYSQQTSEVEVTRWETEAWELKPIVSSCL